MGLVQKIFYFHVPSWFAMFTAGVHLRHRERVYLFRGRPAADRLAAAAAEVAVLFGADGAGHAARCGDARRGASGGRGMRA